jgi:hypothetical protein
VASTVGSTQYTTAAPSSTTPGPALSVGQARNIGRFLVTVTSRPSCSPLPLLGATTTSALPVAKECVIGISVLNNSDNIETFYPTYVRITIDSQHVFTAEGLLHDGFIANIPPHTMQTSRIVIDLPITAEAQEVSINGLAWTFQ